LWSVIHVANAFLQNPKAAVESVLSEFGKHADGNALQDIVLSCQLSVVRTFLNEARLTFTFVFIDMLAKYCAFTSFSLYRNSFFRSHVVTSKSYHNSAGRAASTGSFSPFFRTAVEKESLYWPVVSTPGFQWEFNTFSQTPGSQPACNGWHTQGRGAVVVS
jgi:hypothetical protein